MQSPLKTSIYIPWIPPARCEEGLKDVISESCHVSITRSPNALVTSAVNVNNLSMSNVSFGPQNCHLVLLFPDATSTLPSSFRNSILVHSSNPHLELHHIFVALGS